MKNAEVKAALMARREELIGAISERDDTIDVVTSDEDEDRAQERSEDEVLAALSKSDRQEITQIDEALSRIEKGTYGICAECGEKIPKARLEALPTAALCISCAGHTL